MHTNSFLGIKAIWKAVFLPIWTSSLYFSSLCLSFPHSFCLDMSCNMGRGTGCPVTQFLQAETSEGTGCNLEWEMAQVTHRAGEKGATAIIASRKRPFAFLRSWAPLCEDISYLWPNCGLGGVGFHFLQLHFINLLFTLLSPPNSGLWLLLTLPILIPLKSLPVSHSPKRFLTVPLFSSPKPLDTFRGVNYW